MYKHTDLKNSPVDVLLDPNKFSDDGSIALGIQSASADGLLYAYGLTESGSEWNKIKIRNVETLEDYPEELLYVRRSEISWTNDNEGFFYSVRINLYF